MEKAADTGVSNGLCDGGKRLRVGASNLVKPGNRFSNSRLSLD